MTANVSALDQYVEQHVQESMGQGAEPSCSITTTMSSHPSLWNCGTSPHLKGSSGMANSSHEALLTTRESSSRGWLPSMRCEQCMENCPTASSFSLKEKRRSAARLSMDLYGITVNCWQQMPVSGKLAR